MKPRRTPQSNKVYRLVGGTEDNDLWTEQTELESQPAILSTWELSAEDRQAIADGANIELCVWASRTPPVSLLVTWNELGKGTDDDG